jgi:hypothetical protein
MSERMTNQSLRERFRLPESKSAIASPLSKIRPLLAVLGVILFKAKALRRRFFLSTA